MSIKIFSRKDSFRIIPASCKKCSPKERYEKFIDEHETIVFVDGFALGNKISYKAIEEVRKKYGDQVNIYNTQIDKKIQEYIHEKIGYSFY